MRFFEGNGKEMVTVLTKIMNRLEGVRQSK